jgi:hypothetical protein
MTDEYLSAPSFLAHNAYLKGDYAYIAHYDDGVRVVDISEPYDINEVAYYDTYAGFGLGCWNVYPYFESGKIVASDVETGLWVLFFEGAVGNDGLDPNPPTNFVAYSDYTTPTSMHLTWSDPTTLVDGTPILPSDFMIDILRDGQGVGSVPGGTGEFMDVGLTDGQLYTYAAFAHLIANDSTSRSVTAQWIAGGSRVPSPPAEVSVRGNQTEITIFWTNSSSNVDGTPLDDLAGVRLYQDGTLVETFERMPDRAGLQDSADYAPQVEGFYSWYLTTIDNEVPQNESVPSSSLFTPLSVPFFDEFLTAGEPNASFWVNDDADVDSLASGPPSPPYSLNLNGFPDGGDTVDLRPIDLTGFGGSGVALSYAYQPGGTGNSPEPGDSLMVFFKNDMGVWIKVRSYPGTTVQPFVTEVVDVESAPSGGGSYLYSQFQIRFQSKGTLNNFQVLDDWFVDNVLLSVPSAAEGGGGSLPATYFLGQNYPNPFNPSTTIRFDTPRLGRVRLVVYDVLAEKVRTLMDDVTEAGVHQILWDGKNDMGGQVVSGIYFYRLEAEDFQATRKMLLMK